MDTLSTAPLQALVQNGGGAERGKEEPAVSSRNSGPQTLSSGIIAPPSREPGSLLSLIP